MSKSVKAPDTVVAATKDDRQFKAVEVRRQNGALEVLWAKTLSSESQTWSGFAAECGFVSETDTRKKLSRPCVASVVGLDANAVAFYRIDAPAVGEQETAAIVRMQAESLLPLSPEQIEVAWRKTPSTNGKVDVTIVAARSDYLHRFAENVRDFSPRNILLSCEGTAKAWHRLFSEQERQALVVSIGQRDTQVCLAQNGRVIHAAVLGTGMCDLVSRDDAADSVEPTEAMERFAQDVRTILESFGGHDSAHWPMCVLSNGSKDMDRIVTSLNGADLRARASVVRSEELRLPPGLDAQDVYDYRVPLGLALMALEERPEALDLFTRIGEEQERKRVRSTWRSTRLAGALAAIMLVALVIAAYAVDVATEAHLSKLVGRPKFEQARQRQTLLKAVARHRPDILQLLGDLNAEDSAGVVLDTFRFKKGQPVTLMGQADNEEQMWKFQEHLRHRKGIEEVEIPTAAPDSKTKKIRFTMSFHYKNFTKKGAAL